MICFLKNVKFCNVALILKHPLLCTKRMDIIDVDNIECNEMLNVRADYIVPIEV